MRYKIDTSFDLPDLSGWSGYVEPSYVLCGAGATSDCPDATRSRIMARSGAGQPLWSQGRWEWTAPPGTTVLGKCSPRRRPQAQVASRGRGINRAEGFRPSLEGPGVRIRTRGLRWGNFRRRAPGARSRCAEGLFTDPEPVWSFARLMARPPAGRRRMRSRTSAWRGRRHDDLRATSATTRPSVRATVGHARRHTPIRKRSSAQPMEGLCWYSLM